jgi:beta-lactamase superfamily II metal-dependent hydrolase
VVAALLAGALAVVGLALLSDRPDGRLHLTVLDVGAGTAVLMADRDGARILAGTGADPQKLATALGRVLPLTHRTIDAVLLASGSRAVIGGGTGLAGSYSAATVVALTAPSTAEAALLATLHASGAAVSTDGAIISAITILPVGNSTASGVALLVGDPPARALLLGDLAPADQEELAALHSDQLAADLVVGPARGGVAPALLAATRPHEIAMPTGARDPTAWPGARVRHTAVDGDLHFVATQAGFEAA